MSIVESCDSLFGKTGLGDNFQRRQPIIVKQALVAGKGSLQISDAASMTGPCDLVCPIRTAQSEAWPNRHVELLLV